jgi:hypothetical protein
MVGSDFIVVDCGLQQNNSENKTDRIIWREMIFLNLTATKTYLGVSEHAHLLQIVAESSYSQHSKDGESNFNRFV